MSADHVAAHKVLRARLLTLEVVTTGTTTLEATATGYARASGSFLTDGFAPGMEVTPTGFTQTDIGVVTAVTATALTILGGRDVEASGGSRSLAVALPTLRGWENKRVTPVSGQPWIEEDYVPATQSLMTTNGGSGRTEHEGLYVIRWFSTTDTGFTALRAAADAILALFPAGDGLGTDFRVRGQPGPWAGQITPIAREQGDGWAMLTITIPWRLHARNAA